MQPSATCIMLSTFGANAVIGVVIANGQKTSILIPVSYFHGLFRLISSVFVVLFSTVMCFLLVYIHKPPIDHHIIF